MPPKKYPLASANSTNEASSKKPKLVAVHTNKKYCSLIMINKKKNKNVINYWESSSNGDAKTKLLCALFYNKVMCMEMHFSIHSLR
jgi:hypothetical protein